MSILRIIIVDTNYITIEMSYTAIVIVEKMMLQTSYSIYRDLC